METATITPATNTTTSPTKDSDSTTNDGDGTKTESKAHYDAVKMKYFRSLGMPPTTSPEQVAPSQPIPVRTRSKTANDTQISPKQFQYPLYASSVPENQLEINRKNRSVSTPIPISAGMEDARSPPPHFHLDDDDDGGLDDEEEEIDFYAKMQRLHKGGTKPKKVCLCYTVDPLCLCGVSFVVSPQYKQCVLLSGVCSALAVF
jgi:hypothetical protein